MDRRKLNYIVVGVLLLVALLFWSLRGCSSNTEPTAGGSPNNPEPAYSSSRWSFNPKLGNRDPYGLYVFEQLLIASGKFNAFNEILYFDLMDSIVKTDSNVFMFVGNHFALTEAEVAQLMKAVSKGDELFICAQEFPSYFADKILGQPEFSFYAEDSVLIDIGNESFSMYFLHQKDTLTGVWQGFKKLPPNAKAIASVGKMPVYAQFSHGEGKIHWHHNLKTFQNFQLLRKEGFAYQKEVVREIKNNKIQWLAFADYEPYYEEDEEEGTRTSFLTHIMAHDALRWAFFLAIMALVLFFVFRSKREAPIVPINPDSAIPGISFVDTIAGLYFANKEAGKIVALLRKNFYIAVHEHFFLDIQHRSSNKVLAILAEKTKMPLKRIEALVALLESKDKVTRQQLVEIHGQLRMFYSETGVWKSWKQPDNSRFMHFYRDPMMGYLLVTLGILSIVTGFILLSFAIGTGVLLWPIGITLTYFGAQLLSKPVCSINHKEILLPRLFGEKISIKKSDSYPISITETKVIIKTQTNQYFIEIEKVEPKARKKLIDLLYTFKSN